MSADSGGASFWSWLPFNFSFPSFAIPSFSIPSSIQRRFISFVLKRFLGHLCLPGQLDMEQIDSQIGNGFVEIRDLHLFPEALNAHLADLPIRLVSGSARKITARIPWPNPLVANLGFSLSGLRLSFELLEPTVAQPPSPAKSGPAESVAAIAEHFMHEELSLQEEAVLRDSFHEEGKPSSSVMESARLPPGSIGLYSSRMGHNTLLDSDISDLDPTGISIFASLIERILAKFDFDASDIEIILRKEHDLYIFRLTETLYRTETPDLGANTAPNSALGSAQGEIRRLHVAGLTFSVCDLARDRRASPSSIIRSGTGLSSQECNDFDESEDTQSLMSNSIYLTRSSDPSPPLSNSNESIASELYQSAVSTSFSTNEQVHSQNADVPKQDPETYVEDVVLSFATEPIVFELLTPPNIRHDVLVHDKPTMPDHRLKVKINVGTIASALTATHIRLISELLDAFLPKNNCSPTNRTSSLYKDEVDITIDVRAVVLLLISSPCLFSSTNPTKQRTIDSIRRFFAKPLLPPRLPYNCFRIHIESVSASYALSSYNISSANTTSSSVPIASTLPLVKLAIMDFSIIAFVLSTLDSAHALSFPILVMDPQLISSYHVSEAHIHPNNEKDKDTSLPTFDIVDWTNNLRHGVNSKAWTIRASHLSSKEMGKSDTSRNSAISVIYAERRVDVTIEPVHVFVELELITHFTTLLDDLALFGSSKKPSADSQSRLVPMNPDMKPRPDETREDVSRFQQMVLADLDLGFDYGYKVDERQPESNSAKDFKISPMNPSELNIKVIIPFIRIQIHAPQPTGKVDSRSGFLVFDLHCVNISLGSDLDAESRASIRFSEPAYERPSTSLPSEQSPRPIASLSVQRVVLGYALPKAQKAKAIVSIGSLQNVNETAEIDTSRSFSLPSITFYSRRSKCEKSTPLSSEAAGMTILFHIPSIYANPPKTHLDGLQLFADDVSQWLAKITEGALSNPPESNAPSLIGSRFFAKRTRSTSTMSTAIPEKVQSETIINIIISEAIVRLALSGEENAVCVVDINSTDSDVLIELQPDGKDELMLNMSFRTILISQGFPNSMRPILLPFRSLSQTTNNRPMLQCRLRSLTVPGTIAKQSHFKFTLCAFTFDLQPNTNWVDDLAKFLKSPPGTFETVIPSEKTGIQVNIVNGTVRAFTESQTKAALLFVEDAECYTHLLGNSSDMQLQLSVHSSFTYVTDSSESSTDTITSSSISAKDYWRIKGFSLIAEIHDLNMHFERSSAIGWSDSQVDVTSLFLIVHLCADSISGITSYVNEYLSIAGNGGEKEEFTQANEVSESVPFKEESGTSNVFRSLDESAFKVNPDVGAAPDMIEDDLPSNPIYLGAFSDSADVEVISEQDDNDNDQANRASRETFSHENTLEVGITSNIQGETVKMLVPALSLVDHYYSTLTPEVPNYGFTNFKLRTQNCDIKVFLYEGYDWEETRRTIESETKKVRKRLAKIRQLLANGQSYEPLVEETGALLFNSVYIGLEQHSEELEPEALLNAIDEELGEDLETTSESSWQSFKPHQPTRTSVKLTRGNDAKHNRSREPSVEFSFVNLNLEYDKYQPEESLVYRLLFTIKDIEILDHVKTSTWRRFLTDLQSDIRGNIRETDSNMLKAELCSLHPSGGQSGEEARLKAKILPLRLYVDQDALDFLKRFFSFKHPDEATSSESSNEIFFQHVEIFPVDIKLDYKPRRVDYRALKEGRTIELMNFFHFDGAEMTLRHIVLRGISGWPRVFNTLNDLWTPDVKANQLMDVISGVSPIRSAVNVGSGIADLVLLPIAQYKKDGRIIRGLQKGTTAFVKSTGVEAIKIGAQLATGTQVILEGAENVLGGAFNSPVTAETVQYEEEELQSDVYGDSGELISKYADQPSNIKEGIQSAYRTLSKNIKSAGQTILAVPMEVYENSNDGGPTRAVVRAVPIAVLKPMIGATEAVSKTLLGLRNTLDPQARYENEAKYKRR